MCRKSDVVPKVHISDTLIVVGMMRHVLSTCLLMRISSFSETLSLSQQAGSSNSSISTVSVNTFHLVSLEFSSTRFCQLTGR